MIGLRIPADAKWRLDLTNELLRFPVGVHDDCVDALGLAGQLMDKMLAGKKKPKERKKVRDRWNDDDDDVTDLEYSWKTV